MPLQSKECQRLLANHQKQEEAREDSSIAFRGIMDLLTSTSFQNCEKKYTAVVLGHKST